MIRRDNFHRRGRIYAAPTIFRRIYIVITVVFATASAAQAQSVRGQLRDHLSNAVIADALVQLLGERDRVVASTTSSGRGEYLLKAPVNGAYRMRVLRIGFRPWTSGAVQLDAERIQVQDLAVDAGVVVLAELTVTARSRCRRSPTEDKGMEAVWQQARTMLALVEAGGRSDLEFRLVVHQRTLDPWERLLEEASTRSTGKGTWPIGSLPPDSLIQFGFIQTSDPLDGPTYYGPDVAVFFSDAFLGTHCFRLLPPPKEESELIGLSFEPLPGRKVADIEGVLWVDRRSGLTRLEYRYASMPSWMKKGKAGGMLRFDRLTTGRPIITSWSIQAPIPRIEEKRTVLHGYRQTIGEVEEVRVGTETLWRRISS